MTEAISVCTKLGYKVQVPPQIALPRDNPCSQGFTCFFNIRKIAVDILLNKRKKHLWLFRIFEISC